jgi:hypothetical protein
VHEDYCIIGYDVMQLGKNLPKYSVRGIWRKQICGAQRYKKKMTAHRNEEDVNMWFMDIKLGKYIKPTT